MGGIKENTDFYEICDRCDTRYEGIICDCKGKIKIDKKEFVQVLEKIGDTIKNAKKKRNYNTRRISHTNK